MNKIIKVDSNIAWTTTRNNSLVPMSGINISVDFSADWHQVLLTPISRKGESLHAGMAMQHEEAVNLAYAILKMTGNSPVVTVTGGVADTNDPITILDFDNADPEQEYLVCSDECSCVKCSCVKGVCTICGIDWNGDDMVKQVKEYLKNE